MTTQRTTSAAPPEARPVAPILDLDAHRRSRPLIAVVGISTLWVKRQMLDNKSWRDASADVIADPDVRNALSIFLVNQLYDNVDVAAAIENRLPEGAKSIAGHARRRASPARHERDQPAARQAAGPAALHQRQLGCARQAGQRAREQDRLRDLDRGRAWSRSTCTSSSPSSASRLGLSDRSAREDPGRRRRDHADEARTSSGRPPEGRQGDPRPQRLAADRRARPLRARDLPRAAVTGARPCGTSAGLSRSSGCSCC